MEKYKRDTHLKTAVPLMRKVRRNHPGSEILLTAT